MKAVDKSSEGYKVGASIMGKGNAPSVPVAPKAPKSNNTLPFHRISVEPAANGVTIEHMPVDKKNGGGDYGAATKSVFTDMKAAHAHLGKCLGCGD